MKTCKQCGETKPLDDFYRKGRHTRGHMSRCKECVKANANSYRAANLERVRAYDRERGLLPHRKAGVKARAHRYVNATHKREWDERNAEKKYAHAVVQHALRRGTLKVQPCERCGYVVGVHAHHEDYGKPLEVIWLCKRHHGERHREINEERRKSVS
jgi:hypothetical protein